MPLLTLHEIIDEAQRFDAVETGTERRHALIRRLAEFYSEPSLRQAAIRMAADLKCYEQGRWRHDRVNSFHAYQPGGKAATMRDLMKATNGSVPSGERIREVLAGRKCD